MFKNAESRKLFLRKNWISISLIGCLAGSLLIIGVVFRALAISTANSTVNLVINGKNISTDVPLQIINGRVMVPVRSLAEALGYDVSWDDKTRTVYVTAKNIDSQPGEGQCVPVIPNESIVTGTVLGYSVVSSTLIDITPPQTLYALDIQITKSEDVPGMANYLKNKIGQVIKAYSKEKLSEELFGKTIIARVSYSGDEHGGKYWLSQAKGGGQDNVITCSL